MPYVRQKTWLPLAPRIAGLSVKESPWGFGRNRGMGQTDTTDQGWANTLAQQIASGATAAGPQNPLDISGTNIPLIAPISSAQYNALPTMDLGTWLQQNQGTVLLIGGGLFALALLKGFSGR